MSAEIGLLLTVQSLQIALIPLEAICVTVWMDSLEMGQLVMVCMYVCM